MLTSDADREEQINTDYIMINPKIDPEQVQELSHDQYYDEEAVYYDEEHSSYLQQNQHQLPKINLGDFANEPIQEITARKEQSEVSHQSSEFILEYPKNKKMSGAIKKQIEIEIPEEETPSNLMSSGQITGN